jgi:hypothetical protein
MSGAYPGMGEERTRSAGRGRRGYNGQVVHWATGLDLALQTEGARPPDSRERESSPLNSTVTSSNSLITIGKVHSFGDCPKEMMQPVNGHHKNVSHNRRSYQIRNN